MMALGGQLRDVTARASSQRPKEGHILSPMNCSFCSTTTKPFFYPFLFISKEQVFHLYKRNIEYKVS